MNNNLIYRNGLDLAQTNADVNSIVTIRGQTNTTASVTINNGSTNAYGATNSINNIAYYDGSYYMPNHSISRCMVCGWKTINYSYSSMVSQCTNCGYKKDDFGRSTYSEANPVTPLTYEELKLQMELLNKPGKVEPVQENIINEKEIDTMLTHEDINIGETYRLTPQARSNSCVAVAGLNAEYVYIRNKGGDGNFLEYNTLDVNKVEIDKCSGCIQPRHLEKISNPANTGENKSMLNPLSDLSNLIQRTFSEDTKTLYRAGYLSKDLNITEKLTNAVGEMFVGHIIANDIDKQTFATFADELIKRAKEEIAEVEKKEKK